MNQNREKLFWKLHLTWWTIATVYISFPAPKLPNGPATTAFLFFIIHYFPMVGITYLYRVSINKLKLDNQSFPLLIFSALVGVTITGTLFFFINAEGFLFHYGFWEDHKFTTDERLGYWFDCIWASLPWFMGYHLFKYARFSTERELQLEKSLQESELDRLRKQLNPHFLFNALNGIKALALTEPKASREAIGQLSDLLRLSLKTDLNKNILLSEETKILENYLSIEKIRFDDRMNLEIDIPSSLQHYKVLPFCLQILAENAVKHGIGKLKKGGIIKVLANKLGDNLILKVINTGSLTNSVDDLNENTSIGLENLRKRLKINFGEKAKFDIEEDNGFVVATILLPLEV